MTLRIAMWSGPRNISTAMMRSFSSRADTAVTDEPFYGAFLEASGEQHPLGAETVAAMETDWCNVAAAMKGERTEPIWYQKHMPHHMIGPVGIDDFLDSHVHAFLIRAPERVVASYAKKNELREPELLGFAQLRGYVERVISASGAVPPIVDSDAILADPETLLAALCKALGIAWDPAMLSWKEGPHPEDGIWGAHWYDRVNASTGFEPAPSAFPDLSGDFARVAEACRADYQWLVERSIRPAPN